MNKVAKFVKRVERQAGADQALYHCNPPLNNKHEYVVVSSVSNEWTEETYIFPANEDGQVINWSELEGSEQGVLSHQKVFENIGYIIEQE